MFTWCRKRKADIIFLQETHSTIKTDTQWKNEWGAQIITCHGSSNARGVAILIKNGFDCTIHQKILDPLGRFIILKADIKDKTYVLINVYAPNKDKDLISFFKRENKMNGTQKKKIIVLLFKLPAIEESWILAMLSRDSGHFSNLRRNRNKLTKYRQKSDFFAARNRFVKTFMIYFF